MAVPAIFDVRVLRGSDYYRDRLRERAGRRALVQCRRNPTPAGTAFDAIPAPGHHRPAIDSDLVRGAKRGVLGVQGVRGVQGQEPESRSEEVWAYLVAL